MKKTLTILTTTVLVFSLAGCGQTSSTVVNAASQDQAVSASPEVQAASVSSTADDQTAAGLSSSDTSAAEPAAENKTEGPDENTVSSDNQLQEYSTSKETSENKTSSEAEIKPAADSEAETSGTPADVPESSDITINETIENAEDGGHAILADGTAASYSNSSVNKTGESNGDEADFYGENAAVFATNGGTLDLSEMVITTNGTHANAVFSYGEGTTVNISDSVIETSSDCSGGLMTTGGGTMNASNLNVHTTGRSSAAIRSDRGGGTVTVNGGTYATDGTGSPAIYSTADITVNDAQLTSTASQGIVIEGKNSVALNNVTVNADNNTKNSDKSSWYQAVMIYQSMSGDASVGKASFSMTGGSLTNANGDVFFVNNTAADILLKDAVIVNNGDGVFLRAAAAGWGKEGANGGKVNIYAEGQTIDGDMLIDEISVLNLYLNDGSEFTGAINPDGAGGEVYVGLTDGSVWTLTGDSYITSLSCEADSIDLNGFTLYVSGTAYEAGTAASGTAIEIAAESSGSDGGTQSGKPAGNGDNGDGDTPPQKPGGSNDSGNGNNPPQKPGGSGDSGNGNNPPQKPDDSNDSGNGSTPPQKPGGNGDSGNGDIPPQKPDGSGDSGAPPRKPDGTSDSNNTSSEVTAVNS